MIGKRRVLAFDIGASVGRAMLGTFNGEKIAMEEVHRFPNDPVLINGTLYWDAYRLFHEIKQGIIKALARGEFESIGIDTWGVDFALVRADGSLAEAPVHHRDGRTTGMMEEAERLMSREKLYSITGIQLMQLNTVFQLLSVKKNRSELLERSESLLLMPDLFNYFLTGVKKTESSIASTTQLMDATTRSWSREILSSFGIPERLLPEIAKSGTVLGSLSPAVCQELECPPVKVIAVAGHDTQCAVVSIPSPDEDFLFISSGTWTLFGTETESPILDERSFRLNVTNEGGYGGKITFLNNIVGLWLIQECRRQWARDGKEYSFIDLTNMAREAPSMRCFVDPDDTDFTAPGNMPRKIREYCRRTGQAVPVSDGEIARCVYESLALKYRAALGEIETCTGKRYSRLHVVGGGAQDSLLCSLTASACGRQVVAGPIEATVLGNVIVQLITLGVVPDIAAARRVIAESYPLATYECGDGTEWETANGRWKKILEGAR